MFVWAWWIISIIFTVASVRSSWALVGVLVFVDIDLLLLAVGNMLGQEALLKASSGFGFAAAALACKSYPYSSFSLIFQGTLMLT